MNKQELQNELTSTTGLVWNDRQRKIVILSFVATALSTALILGVGTFLGN